MVVCMKVTDPDDTQILQNLGELFWSEDSLQLTHGILACIKAVVAYTWNADESGGYISIL